MKFSDIAGYSGEKKSLQEICRLLKQYHNLNKMGIRMPRGLLLSGDPGVGKTAMAEALIEESGVPCIRVSSCEALSADELSTYLETKFQAAAEHVPSIVLIDELDKMVGQPDRYRSTYNMDNTRKFLQVMNDHKNDGILCVATVNDMDMLCGALKRSGRFDRIVDIPKPNLIDRTEIIRHYLKGKPVSRSLNIRLLAKMTYGMSGADIECAVNEAGIRAILEKSRVIRQKDMDRAIDQIAFHGTSRENVLGEEQRRLIATHEVGHLLTGLILSPEDVTGITILPQGESEGHTGFADDANGVRSLESVLTRITVLLAGKAAETIYYPDQTYWGSSADIEGAGASCRALLEDEGAYGFTYCIFPKDGYYQGSLHSNEKKATIERKHDQIMIECFEKAKNIVKQHKPLADLIISKLMDQFTLSRQEIMEMFDAYKEKIGISEDRSTETHAS